MKKLLLLVVFVVVVGGVFGALALLGGNSEVGEGSPTAEVKRGPLTISVTETGSLQAREQEVIINEVEGRTEIIFIVEEGARVEEGDLLVELDSSELADRRINQEISVQNAEAAFIRARENLAVAESQATSDVSQAELDYRFAQEDLRKYEDGEYPKEKLELESEITLKREELERAADRLAGSEKLFEQRYIAETELRGDELAKNRAELDHRLALENLKLLEQYTYPRRVTELESAIEQHRLSLERVRRKARSDIVQAEADLRAAEAEFNRQKDRLAKIEDQIEKTKIYSPAAGMVIYATSVNRNRWRDDEPLEAGYQAREREELIYLPTADSLMAEISIHESALEKVEVGQRVRVTIPAVPGRVFDGRVARIAPLPDDGGWWNPDLRVYATQVHIEGAVTGVRTGMSCQAEIIVEEYEDAMYVPVQSVVAQSGQSAVYVRNEDGSMEVRMIEVGMDNNRMVNVLSGLSVGERVSLTPRLDDLDEAIEMDMGGGEGGGTRPESYEESGVVSSDSAGGGA